MDDGVLRCAHGLSSKFKDLEMAGGSGSAIVEAGRLDGPVTTNVPAGEAAAAFRREVKEWLKAAL